MFVPRVHLYSAWVTDPPGVPTLRRDAIYAKHGLGECEPKDSLGAFNLSHASLQINEGA